MVELRNEQYPAAPVVGWHGTDPEPLQTLRKQWFDQRNEDIQKRFEP